MSVLYYYWLFTSVIATWNTTCGSIERQRKNRKEIWCIRALSTTILTIAVKYLVCLPGGWEATRSLDNPMSHQHVRFKESKCVLKLQFQLIIIDLSAFDLQIDPGSKVQEQFLAKTKTLLWLVAKRCFSLDCENWSLMSCIDRHVFLPSRHALRSRSATFLELPGSWKQEIDSLF